MNMANKFCSAIVLLSGCAATTASDYFPHKDSDVSHFQNSYLQQSDIEIVATSGTNWKKYSSFLEQQNQWVWTNNYSNKVYWLSEEGYAELLVDFDDAVGTQYPVNVDGCTDLVEIQNKNKTLTTPAGKFEKVVQLVFIGHCRDGGLLNAWFVEGVGLIKWQSQSIAGPVDYYLTDATIGDANYPVIEGLQISSEIESGLFNLNQKAFASAYMTIVNKNQTAIDLTFNSGQKFEIEILNEGGTVVNRWSDKRMFTEAIETLSILPSEKIRLGGAIELKNFNNFSLHNGDYRLRIMLKGRDDSWQSYANKSAYQMEVPFTVTYESDK